MKSLNKLLNSTIRRSYKSTLTGWIYPMYQRKSELRSAKKWHDNINTKVLSRLRPLPFQSDLEILASSKAPKNSWSIKIDAHGKVQVKHGKGVEQKGNTFFEGVWCGDYDSFDFANSDYIFGSGFSISKNHILITPPSHMYEGIYLIQDKLHDCTVISNSLANALSLHKDILTVDEIEIIVQLAHTKNNEITNAGAMKYDPIIYEDTKIVISFIYFHSLLMTFNGSAKLQFKDNYYSFSNYSQYKSHLTNAMTLAKNNGASPNRGTPLLPLSTISTGYDSPAVTALAKQIGCTQTATIAVSVEQHDDDGSQIAKALGMDCYPCIHPAGSIINNLNFDFKDEILQKSYEFIATPGLGDDVMLTAFDEYINNSILFTGALGDSIWHKKGNLPAGLPVRVVYGKSFTEYRLRKGFAFIPVPILGATYPASIFRISCQSDMKDWRIGGGYDRPIPRRMAEEAGIERGTFAIKKGATNPHPLNFSEHKSHAFLQVMERYYS